MFFLRQSLLSSWAAAVTDTFSYRAKAFMQVVVGTDEEKLQHSEWDDGIVQPCSTITMKTTVQIYFVIKYICSHIRIYQSRLVFSNNIVIKRSIYIVHLVFFCIRKWLFTQVDQLISYFLRICASRILDRT